ncbi:MAG TPA: PDZ domain-containing protein [Pyrinomonadaceae bacterium]|nr:PDZ domain-containing protein [Pyrinomonadaceae bacterium]
MLSKYLCSIIIVTSSFVLVIGQTPEPKMPEAPQAFSFAFDGGGSYLGVQTQEINKENFSKFGLRDVRGVAVEKVMENSPAAAAGLQTGDVIVRFNGEEVTSARKLTRLIGEVDPDHQAKLSIVRNGNEQEITATLAKRPMPKFENGNFSFTMPKMPDMPDLKQLKDLPEFKEFQKDGKPFVFTFPGGEGKSMVWRAGEGRMIGVGVTPLGKQLAAHFGVESGAMIDEVRENSPAAKAGLRAGDIIVEADGKAVKGDIDLIRTINGKKDGDVSLTIVRDGKRQTISVTPEKSKDAGFVFGSDGDGMVIAPGKLDLKQPAIPSMPAIAPVPMTMFRPGRIL